MNNDLIRRGELAEEIKSLRVFVTGLRAGKGVLAEYALQFRDSALRIIDEQAAVDAVEVVRCEKCTHCKTIFPEKRIDQEPTQVLFCEIYRCNRKPDEFCSDGERRKNNG